ncbi:MAG: GTP-binding protein [Clostridiales bacterium]|nr:GTP-binding protein [Clostridiales bacterium]
MNDLLKFITCGSVDDGKSTLIGRLLYDSKLIYADQEQALILDSQAGGAGGEIDYSLLLDGLMAEREQGITIDVAYRYFTAESRAFIVADTPGHEEYTRNMAVGASFADLAVILIDASRGVLTQTRRHARICALMGVRHLVFAVNKMDLAGYSEARFKDILSDIDALSHDFETVAAIPVSASKGDNVTKISKNTPWYNGPSLLSYLETADIRSKDEAPGFYMPVQRVCRPDHTFRGFSGQVEAGEISVGDAVVALPSRQTANVKSLIVAGSKTNTAKKGQPVVIQLDREIDVSRGCVIEAGANLRVGKYIRASLLWMDDDDLNLGGEYWIKIGSRSLPAAVKNINCKIDVNTGEKISAVTLKKNEIALCELMLAQNVVAAPFNERKIMGELILIDRVTNATSACGVIRDVLMTDASGTIFEDSGRSAEVHLFDEFYYHMNENAVFRHRAKAATYKKGDVLPLKSPAYNYPRDFDVALGGYAALIRDGAFFGFGERDETAPLINEYGIGFDEPFETYRSIGLRSDRGEGDRYSWGEGI